MKVFDLPNEILCFVFNKLEIADLIRSRLVSKRFKHLIDNLNKNLQ